MILGSRLGYLSCSKTSRVEGSTLTVGDVALVVVVVGMGVGGGAVHVDGVAVRRRYCDIAPHWGCLTHAYPTVL